MVLRQDGKAENSGDTGRERSPHRGKVSGEFISHHLRIKNFMPGVHHIVPCEDLIFKDKNS